MRYETEVDVPVYKMVEVEQPAKELEDAQGNKLSIPACVIQRPVYVRTDRFTVTLEVDEEEIAQDLGKRAARTKSGRSTYMHGRVRAKRGDKVKSWIEPGRCLTSTPEDLKLLPRCSSADGRCDKHEGHVGPCAY